MTILRRLMLCICLAPLYACSNSSSDAAPVEVEPVELLDLLPSATRGVFQIYPGLDGALASSDTPVPWASGPLQILQHYTAAMALESAATRLLLAQMSDRPNQFVLLAEFEAAFAERSGGLDLIDIGSYRGSQRWTIAGSELQLAQLNPVTVAIAPAATLMRVLDVYAGAAEGIRSGPLGAYLADLATDLPNSFAYALPALYGNAIAPGDGTASLSEARAVSGAFSVIADSLEGAIAFHSDNAERYTAELLSLLAGYRAPAITASAAIASIDLGGLSAQDDIRPLLKTLILDMNAVDYADAVFFPGNAPWLNFNVGEKPNSIFINFEFRGQAERDAFTADHLPAGFTLAPIRILQTDAPRYFLVLNIYQSSGGLVNGARAEWSVFVDDPDTDEPRFLVIEAVADSISADSVNLLTQPEPVTHELAADAIVSYVGEKDPDSGIETLYFTSSIDWPQAPETRVRFHREFVASNDYIFWGNGVADRGLYNGTVHNREGVLVDPKQFNFLDGSDWAQYTGASPVHVVTYLNPLEIVVSPWWNLGAAYLDVSDSYRATLVDFKNNFYPGLVQGNARAAVRGEGISLSPATLAAAVPGAQYHFSLHDPVALIAAAVGPDGPAPRALSLFEGEAADYYLTLSVYLREDDPCGVRVEWITYVTGADGYPESLRLDAFSGQPCLDPMSLMTLAAEVSQTSGDGLLTTQIASPFTRFRAVIDLGLADAVLTGQDWLEAGDRVCAINAICDDFFYDGQLLVTPSLRANAPAVRVEEMVTPWDDYIDSTAVRAGVRLGPAVQVSNHWRNLRAFAADSAVP
ncbi:MAG: hypothetical protein KDI17_16080 [Halioglobus sp.]|nr:hypothetical protein [Halioglobus sp.]